MASEYEQGLADARPFARGEGAGGQEILELGRGQRPAEQETLHIVTVERAEEFSLGFSLHAFGQDAQAEAVGDAGNRVDDRGRTLVLRVQISDERLVDLDAVDRKAAQIVQ